MSKAIYDDLKENVQDDLYVEYDETTNGFGVFGTESGYCYATFSTEREAEEYVAKKLPVSAIAYGLAMEKLNLPDDIPDWWTDEGEPVG